MNKIGWNFPPTGGGVETGINDAGIVTFDGAPLSSLAREILQNSLDARADAERPVHITFELREIEPSEIAGEELAQHLDSCISEWGRDPKARATLRGARDALNAESLQLLGVIDTNTTGLEGKTWRGLVKVAGASFKRSESAGGSFGVGKAAPFTVSPLRTVCYWSAFEDGGTLTEKFQGKAVLVSHKHDFGNGPETTSGTGFFGLTDGCEALEGGDIPKVFRRTPGGKAEPGTAVWIVGFNPDQHGERWQRAIARSVVESFFYGIQQGDLEILLEPDESGGDEALWNIRKAALPALFGQLTNEPEGEDDDDAIDRAQLYWRLVSGGPPTAVMDPPDKDLGRVKLWIGTEDDFPNENLPSRVALIRGTGMIVTDLQAKHRFRRLREYAAVCVIDDDHANKLLRDMENPAHDQFQYERLREEERDRGRLALDRLADFLRTQLRIHAAPPAVEVTDVVDELAEYLFDDHPGPLDGPAAKDGAESAFGQVGAVKKKPPRLRVKPSVTLEDDEPVDGEGGDGSGRGGSGGGGGEGNGGGGGGGGGEGEGSGGAGSRGGSKGRRILELGDVRVVHDPADELRSRVAFTAPETAVAALTIDEAGDAAAIARTDIAVLDEQGEQVSLSRFEMVEGVRYELTITGQQPLADAAWQVGAVVEAEK